MTAPRDNRPRTGPRTGLVGVILFALGMWALIFSLIARLAA